MKESIILEVSEGQILAVHSSNPDVDVYIINHDEDCQSTLPIEPDRLIDKPIQRYLQELTY